jgi:hypothetical protein
MDYLKIVIGKILKNISSLTKGENKMSKKIIGLVMVMMLAAGAAFAAGETGTVDVDVYVTPGGISVTLTAAATFYNFGTIDVNTSSNSATAINLANGSDVSVNMDKTITAINGGGTIVLVNAAPTAQNEFRLRCVEHTARATSDAAYGNAAADFSTTLGTYNNLTSSGTATQVVLGANGEADADDDVWFRIDMPSTVDDSTERKFDVTYQGTAN